MLGFSNFFSKKKEVVKEVSPEVQEEFNKLKKVISRYFVEVPSVDFNSMLDSLEMGCAYRIEPNMETGKLKVVFISAQGELEYSYNMNI